MKFHFELVLFLLMLLLVLLIYDDFRCRRRVRRLLLVKKNLELANQHDYLTGLPNREKLNTDLQELVGRQSPFHLVMLDIDDFKQVNDTYGHLTGDSVLCEISRRILPLCNERLAAYRFAGDEFVFIFQVPDKDEAYLMMHRCTGIFDSPFTIDGVAHQIHGSFGLASYPDDAVAIPEIIALADMKMYRAKASSDT